MLVAFNNNLLKILQFHLSTFASTISWTGPVGLIIITIWIIFISLFYTVPQYCITFNYVACLAFALNAPKKGIVNFDDPWTCSGS